MDQITNWNGHQLCAIDIETTGFDPYLNEIMEIAIIPLNHHFDPVSDKVFNALIKPLNTEHIDPKAISLNKANFEAILEHGMLHSEALDYFYEWFDNLNLPPWKRIIPLAHNWPFDRSFLKVWLGESFDEFFNADYRDTMVIGNFERDWANFHDEQTQFAKVKLQYMCSTFKIEMERAHSALCDAINTAKLYKRLLERMRTIHA